MRISKIIVILIWFFAVVGQIVFSPLFQYPVSAPQVPHLVVFLPLAFFIAVAFLIPGYPFDVERLRLRVDRKFGGGAYAEFVRQLKPMLLFGVTGLVAGVLAFVRAYQAHAPTAAYWEHCFILSGGIGFLLMRVVLAKRGL